MYSTLSDEFQELSPDRASSFMAMNAYHLYNLPSKPKRYYIYSPCCFSKGADKENLFNNQEFLKLVIVSFILMTSMCDAGVIL